MNVLLSIQPRFVEKIFLKEKVFEYRKSIFRNKEIDRVFIYESKPTKKIVGEFRVKNIICDKPQSLWEKTGNKSGVSKDFFDKYFCNKEKAYAIEIMDLIQYKVPIDPYVENPNFIAPQSFCYMKEQSNF